MTAEDGGRSEENWPVSITKPLLYQLSYIGLKTLQRIMRTVRTAVNLFSLRCRHWAAIVVSSWLGTEYWRLRGDAVELSREQSYSILQDALRNYMLLVDNAQCIQDC